MASEGMLRRDPVHPHNQHGSTQRDAARTSDRLPDSRPFGAGVEDEDFVMIESSSTLPQFPSAARSPADDVLNRGSAEGELPPDFDAATTKYLTDLKDCCEMYCRVAQQVVALADQFVNELRGVHKGPEQAPSASDAQSSENGSFSLNYQCAQNLLTSSVLYLHALLILKNFMATLGRGGLQQPVGGADGAGRPTDRVVVAELRMVWFASVD